MPAIGITGGVATGKSSFIRALLGYLPTPRLFDADRCVHELLASDRALHAEIRSEFGSSPFDPAGILDREALRQIVFRDAQARQRLEALIHPRVRAVWQPQAESARTSREVYLFDIPLLYETGIEREFDRVLVVACSPEVQRQRLSQNRGLASDLIEGIIKAQSDLLVKVARADHVVWNDGSPSALDAQARRFASYLRELYG
jgi:dephospho-CoA kinase